VARDGPVSRAAGPDRDWAGDVLERLQEDGVEAPFLAAEVGVQLCLVRSRVADDAFDPRPGDPVPGELGDGGLDDAPSCRDAPRGDRSRGHPTSAQPTGRFAKPDAPVIASHQHTTLFAWRP